MYHQFRFFELKSCIYPRLLLFELKSHYLHLYLIVLISSYIFNGLYEKFNRYWFVYLYRHLTIIEAHSIIEMGVQWILTQYLPLKWTYRGWGHLSCIFINHILVKMTWVEGHESNENKWGEASYISKPFIHPLPLAFLFSLSLLPSFIEK